MSFDLIAQGFVEGEAPDASVAETLQVLRPFLIVGPEPDGFCRTRTPDGGEADFYVGRGGFMVNHFSKGETLELIWKAASVQGLVLFGPGTPAMLTDARLLPHLPPNLAVGPPLPVLVNSGPELDGLIEDDQTTYRTCRERLADADA
jgi:hypothetical protein